MNIKSKVKGKIRKVGNNQLAVVFKNETLEVSWIAKDVSIDVTVTENGQIIIEKAK